MYTEQSEQMRMERARRARARRRKQLRKKRFRRNCVILMLAVVSFG